MDRVGRFAAVRSRAGPWDIRRDPHLTMEKPRPGSGGSVRLTVAGWYAAYRSGEPSWSEATYATHEADARRWLESVQWDDWDRAGRLLVATTGRLQVRDEPWDETSATWSIDLSEDRPAPAEPPSIARRWIE